MDRRRVLHVASAPFEQRRFLRARRPNLPSYLSLGVKCGQPGEALCASQYLDRLHHDRRGLPCVPQP